MESGSQSSRDGVDVRGRTAASRGAAGAGTEELRVDASAAHADVPLARLDDAPRRREQQALHRGGPCRFATVKFPADLVWANGEPALPSDMYLHHWSVLEDAVPVGAAKLVGRELDEEVYGNIRYFGEIVMFLGCAKSGRALGKGWNQWDQ